MEMATACRTIYDCFKRRVRAIPKLGKLRIRDLRHAYAMPALILLLYMLFQRKTLQRAFPFSPSRALLLFLFEIGQIRCFRI